MSEPSIWYVFNKWSLDITSVPVISETEKQIVFIETTSWFEQKDKHRRRRTNKVSDSYEYFPVLEEAKNRRRNFVLAKIASAEQELIRWQNRDTCLSAIPTETVA